MGYNDIFGGLECEKYAKERNHAKILIFDYETKTKAYKKTKIDLSLTNLK